MSGQRTPKRAHPAEMCFECKSWTPGCVDWGECQWIAEAVPGTQYRMTYAYEDCFFAKSMFKRKVSA